MLHNCHAGDVDKKLSSALSVQMPPPPPPGQQQRPGGAPGQGGQQPGAFSGRLPPLQQPGSAFPAPQPRPVASDWARAYREQQNKAAQASTFVHTWQALAQPQRLTRRLMVATAMSSFVTAAATCSADLQRIQHMRVHGRRDILQVAVIALTTSEAPSPLFGSFERALLRLGSC